MSSDHPSNVDNIEAKTTTERIKGMCHVKAEFCRQGPLDKKTLTDLPPIPAPVATASKGGGDDAPRMKDSERLTDEKNFFESAVAQKECAKAHVKLVTARKKRNRDTNGGTQPCPTGEGENTGEETPRAEPAAASATVVATEPRRPPLNIRGMTYLSPLTTVGNLPYRRVCKEYGADITCGEMALAHNLLRLQRSEWSLLRKHDSEGGGGAKGLFGVQIATGNSVEAAGIAEVLSKTDFDFDFVDLNCGCPIDLVYNQGCGSALLHHPRRIRDIVSGFTSYLPASRCATTIKVRIGEDERKPTLHKWIPEIESWGVQGITIHGRSRRQRYTKEANWDYIAQCADLTNVPVIGNGDIFSFVDYNDHMQNHKAQAVMIGRGALIKPWIFDEIKNQRHWDISSHERMEMLKRYVSHGLTHWGSDARGVETTRRFLLEWLCFLYRYVPVGLLETLPQRMNERPPAFVGRDDLETLMASDDVKDWVHLSEMLLGPVPSTFSFTPKHKSNMYTVTADGTPIAMAEHGGKITEE
eukprot:PhM_4_TR8895/c0_g1_i1/m.88146/K05544/DUS3; tRNA-dihydrouridine synthase 3